MKKEHLLSLLEKAEAGDNEALDLIEDATYKDFKGFNMDTILRFSNVTDISLIEYFSREELLEEAYITKAEYDDAEYAGIHAEEI